MALQVLAILSASKDGLEIDTQLSEASPVPEQTQKKPSSTTTESKTKSDARSKSPQPKTKGTVEAKSKPQLNKYFKLFLLELLKMFGRDRSLLEKKGSFIIR